jgi:hypothetical protein
MVALVVLGMSSVWLIVGASAVLLFYKLSDWARSCRVFHVGGELNMRRQGASKRLQTERLDGKLIAPEYFVTRERFRAENRIFRRLDFHVILWVSGA